MTIDKQRVEAVTTLESLGFTFAGGKWLHPNPTNYTAWALLVQAHADILHAQLVARADALAGCTATSPEEQELAAITEAIESYEAVRWPDGKLPGGKA
jgi:hypothetical protein